MNENLEGIIGNQKKDYSLSGKKITLSTYFPVGVISELQELITNENITDARVFSERVISKFIEPDADNIQKLLSNATEDDLINLLVFFVKNLPDSTRRQDTFKKFEAAPSFIHFKDELVEFIDLSQKELLEILSPFKEQMNLAKLSKVEFSKIKSPIINAFNIAKELNKNSALKSVMKIDNLGSSISDKFKIELPTMKFKDVLGKLRNEKMIEPAKVMLPNFNAYTNTKDIDIDEFLDQLNGEVNEIVGPMCVNCGKSIDDSFHFYKIELDDKTTFHICSPDCIKKYYAEKPAMKHQTARTFEITRCTAFFKCAEIDNLRVMCKRTKIVAGKDIDKFAISTSNFCEPAEAGIILSTHKTHEVLDNFEKTVNANHVYLMDFIDKFKGENDKQAKTTLWLTYLIIVLTIFNIVIVIYQVYLQKNDNTSKYVENIAKVSNEVPKTLEKIETNTDNIIKTELQRTEQEISLMQSGIDKLSNDSSTIKEIHTLIAKVLPPFEEFLKKQNMNIKKEKPKDD